MVIVFSLAIRRRPAKIVYLCKMLSFFAIAFYMPEQFYWFFNLTYLNSQYLQAAHRNAVVQR